VRLVVVAAAVLEVAKVLRAVMVLQIQAVVVEAVEAVLLAALEALA
jgi:hypothetical protein